MQLRCSTIFSRHIWFTQVFFIVIPVVWLFSISSLFTSLLYCCFPLPAFIPAVWILFLCQAVDTLCAALKKNPACWFCLLSLKCATCVVSVGRRIFGVGGGARGWTGLVGTRQLILCMGLVWSDVRILAQSKRFFLILITTLLLNPIVCAV